MGLTDKWEIEQTWGSHQAVLKAVLEVLQPQSAVECGSGNFSTPYLQAVPQLHTIEHDKRWADKVRKEYPSPAGHRWTVKTFKAKNPTRIDELPPGEFRAMFAFYIRTAEEESPFDLLFVDTFTSCRVPSVSTLGAKARWIIIHDLEPPGPEVYQWPLLRAFLEPWNKYIHKPLGNVGNGHQIPWTGICSRDPLPLERLNEVVVRESQRLWGKDTALEEVEEV